MLRHLNTERREGKLRLQYYREDSTALDDPIFEYAVSRTAIGVSFAEGIHACVVGERQFLHDERSLREQRDGGSGRVRMDRMFVALAEAHGTLAEEVFGEIVKLKDDYCAGVLFGPNKPIHLAESLRATEGLSYYATDRPRVAEERWPSFRTFETRAGIYMSDRPDEETLHRDLEHFFTTPVRDPETNDPVLAKDQSQVNQLMLPTDFPTQSVFAGFQQGRTGPCESLWYAVRGLSKSNPPLPSRKPMKSPERRGITQAGY